MIITKFLFFNIIGITICNGLITIDIEPDELQKMGEILVEAYVQQQLTHRSISSVMLSNGKKIVYATIQLIGLLLTLVGANLATTKLEHFMIPSPSVVMNISASAGVPTIGPKMCKREFGCDRNACWRNCDSELGDGEKSKAKSWCFTTPKTNEKKKIFNIVHIHTSVHLVGIVSVHAVHQRKFQK